MEADQTFPNDPRALSLPERHAWAQRLRPAQRAWLDRLRTLADPPPAMDFPAFLLATPAFAALACRVGSAQRRVHLPTAVADELDRFTDAYRDYLNTCAGEDVFATGTRRAS